MREMCAKDAIVHQVIVFNDILILEIIYSVI